MIPMKAPPNVLSLSIGGSQFPVVNGVVQVPPPYVKHALAHKFLLLDDKNADELIASDLEAALSKAQAAIPVRGMQAKPGMKSLVLEGVPYTIGDDGYVEVPENVEGIATLLGCKPTGLRKVDDPKAPSPFNEKNVPRDKDGLRLDGPTLPVFIEAGYKPEHYPPQGYADKRTWEELEAAKAPAPVVSASGQSDGGAAQPTAEELEAARLAAAHSADDPPLPTVEQVRAMPDADLRAFMKQHGVEFLGDAKRGTMNKAAIDLVAKLQAEATKKD